MTFEDWKSGFLDHAKTNGFSAGFLSNIAPKLTHSQAPSLADGAQPEARKTLQHYLATCVTPARIRDGQLSLRAHQPLFDKIEATYNVDRHIVAAIWGMETNYGAIRGDVNVLSALASLAFAGRRRALFEGQLLAAFTIIDRGYCDAESLIGSWAGAMGHTQFMPTSYLDYATSLGGGSADIWGDDASDALASCANYLSHHGWNNDQVWGSEVTYPKSANLYDLRHHPAESAMGWETLGVRAVHALPDNGNYVFILPGGVDAPGFLVGQNYQALLAYNNAAAYAIGVGHLSDRIKGAGAFDHIWPQTAKGLTMGEMQEVQTRLTAAGFDTKGSDGFTGPNTIAAIDAYQLAHDLPIDGHADPALLSHLRAGVAQR